MSAQISDWTETLSLLCILSPKEKPVPFKKYSELIEMLMIHIHGFLTALLTMAEIALGYDYYFLVKNGIFVLERYKSSRFLCCSTRIRSFAK